MLKEDHPLVGAIIVAVCDEYRQEHFQLRLADGKPQYLVPSIDDEGNAPGTYFLYEDTEEERAEMKDFLEGPAVCVLCGGMKLRQRRTSGSLSDD